MAKINANYEAVYILQPDLSEEQIAALVAKFKAVVEANGTVSEIDEWGKRRLAYPINDLNEGYYVLMTFNAAAAIPPRAGPSVPDQRQRDAFPDRLQGPVREAGICSTRSSSWVV